MALAFAGWREIVLALAVVTLLVAALLWLLVPDKESANQPGGFAEQWAGLKSIFQSRHFWRYGPMGFWFTGGFMALHGLWASRWMAVEEGLGSAQIAARLTGISGAMLAGFLFMGFFATWLVRRGLPLEKLYLGAMGSALLVLASLTAWPGQAAGLLWPLLGACFSLSNIAYSLVARVFPTALAGRANTALNLLVFAGAFGLQWGIGILVDGLRAAGWASDAAFRIAFATLLVGQLGALLWLLRRTPVEGD
jgi:predicted MFS family arabinose efflux permease